MIEMEHFIRFFNCPIPVTGCNLRCDYCYLVQQGNEKLLDFRESNEGFKYSVGHMLKALTPERLGGICAFHICGEGETLLWQDICSFAIGLFKMGHFVSFTSNCTLTGVIKKFVRFPVEYRKKMFFKCSFHYREFKRLGLLERFAENVNLLAEAGISYTVELVTNDYVLRNIEEIKDFSYRNFGALPQILTQRSELLKGKYPRMASVMSLQEYAETWGQFDSPLFDYQQKEFDKRHDEYCYAGVYSFQFHLKDGNVFPCPGNNHKIANLFECIDEKPRFVPVGHNCPLDNCWFGFVTNVLGGCNRELQSNVYFKDFRNRVRRDNGREWLSETMKEAYGHRCSEFHDRLGEDKEIFLDILMRKFYFNRNPTSLEHGRLNELVKCYFENKFYKNVIIYGMSNLGEWIKDILRDLGINVVCGMDRRYEEIRSDIRVISPVDKIPEADVIIVTAYSMYSDIAAMLKTRTDMEIISILDLA